MGRLGPALVSIALLSIAATAIQAQPVADFYKGKQLRMVIGTEAGQDYDTWGRVELTTLTKEFFMPRFLERDEALRRKPRAPYEWDGVAEVRPFGAMENKIVEGVY